MKEKVAGVKREKKDQRSQKKVIIEGEKEEYSQGEDQEQKKQHLRKDGRNKGKERIADSSPEKWGCESHIKKTQTQEKHCADEGGGKERRKQERVSNTYQD